MYGEIKRTYADGSNTFNVPEVATKVPELNLLIDQLEKEVYRLDEEVRGLAARLSPFSLPEVVKQKLTEATPRPPHSEFYNHLDGLRLRLADVSVFISELKQRLEV